MPNKFSLKWIFVFVVLCALIAGYVRSATKQRFLIECINASGGHVGYHRHGKAPAVADWVSNLIGDDYVYSVGSVVVRGSGPPVNDRRLLGCVSKLQDLRKLILEGIAVDRDFLRDVGNMHSIRQLWISRAGLQDADLALLTGLKELSSLHLDDNPIGDAGVKHIAGLPSLNELNLDGTHASAKSLRELSGSELQFLSIVGTRVKVDDLRLLQDFPQLDMVYVSGSIPADTEIRRLEQTISADIVPMGGAEETSGNE